MMSPSVTTDPAALAASIAQWWALAGVDVAVQDMPRDWLTKSRPTPIPAPTPAAVPSFAPIADTMVPDYGSASPVAPDQVQQAIEHITGPMPTDLDAFLDWLSNDPGQPEATFSQTRIMPRAIHQPELLVVTDMPTQEDMAAGQLFSSADARLLSGMLRALGMDMEKTAVASLLLARPAGGIMDDRIVRRASERLAHFARLLSPTTVILLGDKTSRAFQQTNGTPTNLSTYAINLDDGMIPAIALPAPFVLLKHPERKAAAWAQLRQLAKR